MDIVMQKLADLYSSALNRKEGEDSRAFVSRASYWLRCEFYRRNAVTERQRAEVRKELFGADNLIEFYLKMNV